MNVSPGFDLHGVFLSMIVRPVLRFLAALLLLAPGVGTPAHAQKGEKDVPAYLRTNSPGVFAAFRPVVAQPSQSTVRIRCGDKKEPVALGTVVGADGWILT